MLRIATVDDNPADLKEIRMCLSHYFQKRAGQTPIDYTISAYTSGPSFWKILKEATTTSSSLTSTCPA